MQLRNFTDLNEGHECYLLGIVSANHKSISSRAVSQCCT